MHFSNNKSLWTSLMVGAVIAVGAIAGPVTLPNTFQPHTPARAAEVNANFTAVKTAVDDNDQRITTLAAGQTSLQTADGQNWKRGGNAGTSVATDFIGTADAQALEVRVNNQRALRITPAANGPNVVFGSSVCASEVGVNVKGAFIGGGNAPGALAACVTNPVERHKIYDNNNVIVGGYSNTTGSNDATTTNAEFAAVVAGVFNAATGPSSFVGAGDANVASGDGAAVVAGTHNTASGRAALAGGLYASALHAGSFVWSGANTADGISSTGVGQFVVRAPGGIYLGSATTTATMASGAFISTSTGATLSTGGTWTNASDVSLKANLRPVANDDVLQAVKRLPLYTWNYRTEGEQTRHIGPTAQDFSSAFGFGTDDRHIATIDADGVALAAIQGLSRVVDAQRATIDTQRAQLSALEARLAALERRDSK